ncbi:hypothetical protein Ctu_1p00930 (plasmid) [Cronobacter turicensis z3032]|uniref:Uncharacterized protein n=1 Tax=Cronobacter turicensis (strain DSM 18703 / CCUG 55852 / LMG 23827 / z3032) TaxID=693216 RepID=C9Y5I5_CROTZ|nr:hypothetical protein Ctu_1p00930 [Cronobacter turicensis z3032]
MCFAIPAPVIQQAAKRVRASPPRFYKAHAISPLKSKGVLKNMFKKGKELTERRREQRRMNKKHR